QLTAIPGIGEKMVEKIQLAVADRKSTRLNSSHLVTSYAVFCLKKKMIILLLHFLSLMLGSVLVLMLPLLVWLTPDLRIKKSLLKYNLTIRTRLPRCNIFFIKILLAPSSTLFPYTTLFRSQLTAIPGIGEKMVEKIQLAV